MLVLFRYKLLGCPAASVDSLLTAKELGLIDPGLNQTLDKFRAMLDEKKAVEADSTLGAAAKRRAIEVRSPSTFSTFLRFGTRLSLKAPFRPRDAHAHNALLPSGDSVRRRGD